MKRNAMRPFNSQTNSLSGLLKSRMPRGIGESAGGIPFSLGSLGLNPGQNPINQKILNNLRARRSNSEEDSSNNTNDEEHSQLVTQTPEVTTQQPSANTDQNQSEQATNPIQMGRKLPHIKQMMTNITTLTINDVAKIIKNYGCYCYIDGNRTPGHKFNQAAKPLDKLDQACRKLYRAEKCLEIDSINGIYNGACSMNDGYKWHMDENTNQITCGDESERKRDKHNQDLPNGELNTKTHCKMSLCHLEKSFALIVKDLLDQGFVNNPDYYKMNDSEYFDKCVKDYQNRKIPGMGNGAMACCGEGVNRRSYNAMNSDCCSDGSVRPFGMC